MWSEHRLFEHGHGRKRFHHDLVGEMILNYETLTISGDDGLFISTYAADPGSASAERLDLLVAWTMEHDTSSGDPHSPRGFSGEQPRAQGQ